MKRDELPAAVRLIGALRWAALATTGADGAAQASMVSYAPEPDLCAFVLHLSRLAGHTRNLLRDPRAALVIGEPDSGAGDPQTLARITLEGTAAVLAPDAPAYAPARALYLARLPDAEPRFEFADFLLFRFEVARARWVGGFARACTLSPRDLRAAAGAD